MITVSAQRELLWKAKCQQQQVWLTAFPGTKLKANRVQELSSKNHTRCKFSIRAPLWKPTLVSSLQVCAAQYSTPGDWLAGNALFISEEFPLGVHYILLGLACLLFYCSRWSLLLGLILTCHTVIFIQVSNIIKHFDAYFWVPFFLSGGKKCFEGLKVGVSEQGSEPNIGTNQDLWLDYKACSVWIKSSWNLVWRLLSLSMNPVIIYIDNTSLK